MGMSAQTGSKRGSLRPQDIIADGEEAASKMVTPNALIRWGLGKSSPSLGPVKDTSAVSKAAEQGRSKTRNRIHSQPPLTGIALSIKQQVEKEDRFLIDPRRTRWMTWWDITVMMALLFTAIVTPVEVAFIPPGGACVTPLFAVNRLVDTVCVCLPCFEPRTPSTRFHGRFSSFLLS